ncbi:hypothetical protein A6A06_37750 [Streptomyces sp. CB02923]|uniref:hypothetical protein n=1 Tax=Streptomyces sp. CB02923 TaxID=1718985 RepID=UPI00093BE3EF|nr:hypothetical protein [Streptomyces sp. CB02923]OKI06246.1 hypothetical protein A6A06_37750 [Streptomyces sp. CB02923]
MPLSMNQRYVNAYDVVPLAWCDLPEAEDWYPPSEGPVANLDVKALLSEIDLLKKHNVYVQPSAQGTCSMNTDYSLYDHELVNETLDDFLGQVAVQHSNSVYLTLLGAPAALSGPVVTAAPSHRRRAGPVTRSSSPARASLTGPRCSSRRTSRAGSASGPRP